MGAVQPHAAQRPGRRLSGVPILLWALVMTPAVFMWPIAEPDIARIIQSSTYTRRDVQVPLLDKFYGLKPVDAVLSMLTASFASLQFHRESRFYWNTFDFVAQYGPIYAFLMLEAARKCHPRRLIVYTMLLAFVQQFLTGGLMQPLFFYFLHNSIKLDRIVSSKASQTVDNAAALAIFPTMAVAFYIPHFSSFLEPDLFSRHWWNWIWQLWSLWAALVFCFASMLATVLLTSLRHVRKFPTSLKATRFTAVGLVILSTGTYWYTHATSPYSWARVMVPRYLLASAPDAEEAMGTIIQYDYIAVFGSALTWIAYQLGDLKAAGLLQASWSRIITVGIVIGALFGPGTLWIVAFMTREEMLVAATTRQESRGDRKHK